jgi:hypothetical protein
VFIEVAGTQLSLAEISRFAGVEPPRREAILDALISAGFMSRAVTTATGPERLMMPWRAEPTNFTSTAVANTDMTGTTVRHRYRSRSALEYRGVD